MEKRRNEQKLDYQKHPRSRRSSGLINKDQNQENAKQWLIRYATWFVYLRQIWTGEVRLE